MVTLRQLHSCRPECIGLEGGLDALGDYLQRCCLQQRRKPVQPGRWRLVVGSKFGDELAIDLDEVEVAAREQRQIRAGESRVIERDLRAGAWNAVERIEAQLVGYGALRNFNYQLLYVRA
jgi:hypothetical protein